MQKIGPVVQLDRISDFGSEGWGFKSSLGHENKAINREQKFPIIIQFTVSANSIIIFTPPIPKSKMGVSRSFPSFVYKWFTNFACILEFVNRKIKTRALKVLFFLTNR